MVSFANHSTSVWMWLLSPTNTLHGRVILEPVGKRKIKKNPKHLVTYGELLLVKTNISSGRSSSHTRQAPLHSKLKLSPRLLLIPYSLAARPGSLAVLPAANQTTFPLQHLAILALDTFLRRQSCIPVALLLLTYGSPKGTVSFTTLEQLH